MPETLVTIAYLAAGILFIFSLGGLSAQESARRGNMFGMIGMVMAVLVTAFGPRVESYTVLTGALVIGGAIGAMLAARVEMTSMPQLVAILHSFVGLAGVLVGIATAMDHSKALYGVEEKIHNSEIFIGVFVGAVTFTGSVIAFGKLQGLIGSKPLLLPARHLINLVALLACVYLGFIFVTHDEYFAPIWPLYACTALAFLLGVHLVMAIGGADMPVVVSMLNSYSGWAAAALGFTLENITLIITGALVGSSGAILSYIMCHAMNRSFLSVILGGFGADEGAAPGGATAQPAGEVKSVTADETADLLRDAKSVIIVPGYGMAVAQAQHALREMADELRDEGVEVKFAIHPVAGRMPGHMNVLLAEANVPYDDVYELEDINSEFSTADVAFVIGANDVTNPAAKTDPTSPIFGMPILDVEKARTVLFVKRGMSSGYAGVENELLFRDNTMMLFGDAKKMVEGILKSL